jgi:hypothetical protein
MYACHLADKFVNHIANFGSPNKAIFFSPTKIHSFPNSHRGSIDMKKQFERSGWYATGKLTAGI